MARASRPNGLVDRSELPDDMEVFVVVGPTIRDSLGAYCTTGQQAALNETDAKRYHKANLIKVDLPEFGKRKAANAAEAAAALAALGDQKDVKDDTDSQPGKGEGGKAAPHAGTNRRTTSA